MVKHPQPRIIDNLSAKLADGLRDENLLAKEKCPVVESTAPLKVGAMENHERPKWSVYLSRQQRNVSVPVAPASNKSAQRVSQCREH